MTMKNSKDWYDSLASLALKNKHFCFPKYVAGLLYFKKFYKYWYHNFSPNSKLSYLYNADISNILKSIQGSITHNTLSRVIAISNSCFEDALDFAYLSIRTHRTIGGIFMNSDFITFLKLMPNYQEIDGLIANQAKHYDFLSVITDALKNGYVTKEEYEYMLKSFTKGSGIPMKVI